MTSEAKNISLLFFLLLVVLYILYCVLCQQTTSLTPTGFVIFVILRPDRRDRSRFKRVAHKRLSFSLSLCGSRKVTKQLFWKLGAFWGCASSTTVSDTKVLWQFFKLYYSFLVKKNYTSYTFGPRVEKQRLQISSTRANCGWRPREDFGQLSQWRSPVDIYATLFFRVYLIYVVLNTRDTQMILEVRSKVPYDTFL